MAGKPPGYSGLWFRIGGKRATVQRQKDASLPVRGSRFAHTRKLSADDLLELSNVVNGISEKALELNADLFAFASAALAIIDGKQAQPTSAELSTYRSVLNKAHKASGLLHAGVDNMRRVLNQHRGN